MVRGRELAYLEETGEEIQALWVRGPMVAVLSALLTCAGTLNVAAFLSDNLRGLVGRLGIFAIPLGAPSRPFLLLSGLWFLFLAYQIWLKKKAARYVLMGWLLLKAAFSFAFHRQVMVPFLTLAFLPPLWAFRGEFIVEPDSRASRRLRTLAPLFLAAFLILAGAGFWILRRDPNLQGNVSAFFRYLAGTVSAGFQTGARGGAALLGRLSTTLFYIGFLWCAALLFRPHGEPSPPSEEERRRARRLVERYGSDGIAYFNLRKDKNLFFLDGRSFLAYRCWGGTVLVTGDPVGQPGSAAETMVRFRNFCFSRGWRLACLGAGPGHLEVYEGMGLRSLCYGEEAVVELGDFTLEGRKHKSLRHAVRKWERMGTRMEFMFNAGIPSHLRHELQDISRSWRGNNPETGFSMGLGRLLHSEDPDCLLAVAYDRDERPIGFAYLVPIYPRLGYSLDITRIDRNAPNGLNDFIFAKTALFLKERGYRLLSLHFAAFSTHYRKDREGGGSSVVRGLCRLADLVLPVMSLYEYDRKFQPRWQPRYLLFESYLDLPRVGLAAIRAESFHRLARRARKPMRRVVEGRMR